MKKIVSLSLAALALAALAAPVYAQKYEASIRGDVGAIGSQVIFDSPLVDSDRNEWNWDFTARLAMYTSCRPCSTYVALSWQGATNTNHSRGDITFANRLSVKNEFSKTKLGMGLDVFKNNCLKFTMEVGGNYLVAKLDTDRNLTYNNNTQVTGSSHSKTEGAGLYSSIKGSYKLPSSCFLGNAFSVYGKAEVADIIGRQSYHYDRLNDPEIALNSRYNNIVEVDIEAAVVYSPCFKCWDNMNMSVAFGVRTDSFVNLFRHVDAVDPNPNVASNHVSLLSLTKPSLFLELSMKM